MQRSAALQCRGEVTFHHLDDGQDFFNRAMAVRWVSSPEPISSHIYSVDDFTKPRYVIQDFSRGAAESRIDVYPGEEELLDVAVRFDDDPDCYGWNNDAYFHNFHNPSWRLPSGRYLVKVVITSSGQKCVGVFRLVNAELWTDFRLLEAMAGDREKIR
jgi:hypothetical protein